MNRKKVMPLIALLALGASGVWMVGCTKCSGKGVAERPSAEKVAETKNENVLTEEVSVGEMKEPMFYQSVEQAKEHCAKYLKLADDLKKQVLSVKGERNFENTLKPFNEIFIALDRVNGVNELMASVHPDSAIRDRAEACERDAAKVTDELKFDRDLYEALSAVKTEGLDEGAKRFVHLLDRDYRLSGVDKDEETRKKLADISAKMVVAQQEFAKNIRDSKLTEQFTREESEGLPEDFFKTHPADENGKITITTDYTDYFPFMSYVKSEDARKRMMLTFNRRAFPANVSVFANLLDLRHQYATLLGFDSWAAYTAADKMTKNVETIEGFLSKAAEISLPRAQRDVALMLERKKADIPTAEQVFAWDRSYYTEKIKAERYHVDSREVRKYFAYDKVRQGLFDTVSRFYGVTIKEREGAKVWHEDVKAYELHDEQGLIGYFYLDMHPRDGKYKHAAMFGMLNGIPGTQPSAASLVCNFPKPTADDPAYMEFREVETFFHEFGHLLHHLFSGRLAWSNQSGIQTEWDFVEAPSQLFEEWVHDYDVLKEFAKNDKGEVIAEELVGRINEADNVSLGADQRRQMFLAQLSFRYHSLKPGTFDLKEKMVELYKEYMPYPYVEGDEFFTSFGHLNGYSSSYYTYMWSLSIAKDMLSVFKESGMMNKETAKRYRDTIISRGGSKDAADLVKDFLGRPYNLEAFEKWLSE